MGVTALWYHAGHQGETPWDLNDVSESQALWSIAFVLLALRWQPPMEWLARIRPLDTAVSVLNARAVTVYLWHNLAIAAVWPVLAVLALDDFGARLEGLTEFAVALALTFFAVLAFGWAEDLGARKRPSLWPIARAAREKPVTPPPGMPVDFEPVVARRTTAAAAMHRMPANWPPPPRTARDEDDDSAGTRHEPTVGELAVRGWPAGQAAGHDPGTTGHNPGHDPGMPVAGRQAEPLTPDEPSEWFRP
jgi:hypothetical protein